MVWAQERESKPRSREVLNQTMALSLSRRRLQVEMARSSLSAALLDPRKSQASLEAYIRRALSDLTDEPE